MEGLSSTYRAPDQTRVGHIHLKVSNLKRSIEFYQGLLGFELTMMYGDQAAFLSAGGYHHHIGLNTWHSANALKAPKSAVGLYHVAFAYPTRKDLAAIFDRLRSASYPLRGASDHGVSEALYIDDPDGNGIELYWDRPVELWPKDIHGRVTMYTRPLNLHGLLDELNNDDEDVEVHAEPNWNAENN